MSRLHKVYEYYALVSPELTSITADVEAEDMDLGGDQMDLALDVDGDNADFDDEALDSDDDLNDQELGIDTEESDGSCVFSSSLPYFLIRHPHVGSAYAHRTLICIATKRETNASVQAPTTRSPPCSRFN